MDAVQAQRAVESLRKGIPPEGFVRHFTVGRHEQIEGLAERLGERGTTVLLLQANYGAGKSHLLRYLREEALDRGYVVSSVTCDAKSAVRFNLMAQVFGAICRGIELPGAAGNKGIRPLFDHLARSAQFGKDKAEWMKITDRGRWDYSDALDSQAVFIALRAWATGQIDARNLVEDWLSQPWTYKVQRKMLYLVLVQNLRGYFRDPRPEWKFYADKSFIFDADRHEQSWAALRDFDRLARAAGLKGLVILFDEFEDVINNITNVGHQEAAFWNLFDLYSGKRFRGKSFFAVTPAFVDKCKQRLTDKGRWDFDYSRFDALPTFEMDPLSTLELYQLSLKIREAHGLAYGWHPSQKLAAKHLQHLVKKAASTHVQDRARHTIVSVVQALDEALQE